MIAKLDLAALRKVVDGETNPTRRLCATRALARLEAAEAIIVQLRVIVAEELAMDEAREARSAHSTRLTWSADMAQARINFLDRLDAALNGTEAKAP